MVASAPPRPPRRLTAVGASETGRVRPHNEDRILVRDDLQLYAVADGAGGHAAGDIAAQVALLSLVNFLEATAAERKASPDFDRFGVAHAARWLARAVQKANRDVHEIANQHHTSKGMGSTIVVAHFIPHTGQLHVAHVGDSRCYRMRSAVLEQLTRDHSLLNDVLEERPDLGEEVLAKLPRNVVTRALGMQPTTRVSIGSFDVLSGDRFMLCSDGLCGYVPAQKIGEILGDPRPAGARTQLLLNAADETGGHDNVSVVVIEAGPSSGASDRPRIPRPTPPQRELQASAPELLLVSIEEIDVAKAITALTAGKASEQSDADLIEELLAEARSSR